MYKIYSKIVPNKLLHIVFRFEDIEGRIDICPQEEYMQCASLDLHKGMKFKPHKHIPKTFKSDNFIAQEAFMVFKGSVKCFYYDLDDKIIEEQTIFAGDVSFTFFGAHNYEIMEHSIVYEFKTGPYYGPEKDRIRI